MCRNAQLLAILVLVPTMWIHLNLPRTFAQAAPTFPGIGDSETARDDTDGFISIFDGQSLNGWHAVPSDGVSDWTVEDGAIVGSGSQDRLCYLVWQDDQLDDFILEFQYRLPGEGNTGVEIRSRRDATGKRPFEGYHADLGHVGIGAHILGAWDFHFAQGTEPPCPRGTRLVIDSHGHLHSSFIANPLTEQDIRDQDWNEARVIAEGNHFQFSVNGRLASEFTDYAPLRGLDQGALGLQIHDKGMTVQFKDVRLKRLPKVPLEKLSDRDKEALRLAENALVFQRDWGGWPKNYDRRAEITEASNLVITARKSDDDATIDNGATHTEIRLLADAFRISQDDRFRLAALKGIEYLLDGQYENGGWPQVFPKPRGYASHITFNDNAMVGVLRLLQDVSRSDDYAHVPPATRVRARQAVERGIGCILKCQLLQNGVPTVWCAQHDEQTLLPAQARSYELPSLSGSESVGIVRFLMQLDEPSAEVVAAIEGAVNWFEKVKLTGIKVEQVEAPSTPRGYDRIVVADSTAAPMWARFYDLETNQPFFCSRDGVPRRTLAEISYERRNGYSWLGYYAQDLLGKDFPAWRARVREQ